MSTTLKVYFVESEELEPTEIRRFMWELSSSLRELLCKISSVFSTKLVPELTAVHIIGENGDRTNIESDFELKRVFQLAPNQSIVKLWVTRVEQLECEPSFVETDSWGLELGTDEAPTDCLYPQVECDGLQMDSEVLNMEPTTETETKDMMKSQQKIYEGLQRVDSDESDARFHTSYGKSGFASIFSQIAKDIGCWATSPGQKNSAPPDLPPQFVESLCTLREMGFDVENTNILKILRKNNGELERTITEVMDSSF